MVHLEHLPADVRELTPLARAALSGGLELSDITVPRALTDIPLTASGPAPPATDRRARLAEMLEAEIACVEPHVRVLDAVRALAEPDTLAVLTACPPGFLGSPVSALYRALQCVRLAAELERHDKRRVVPVLFNQADGNAIERVHPAWVLNPNLDLRRVGLSGLAARGPSYARLVLTDELQKLGALRALLRQTLYDEPHCEEALRIFMPREGESLARAFTRSMSELLGHLGLIVLEPGWLRSELSHALIQAVALDPAPLVARDQRELLSRGLATDDGCPESDRGAYALHLEPAACRELHPGGDGFRYPGEAGSRTAAELAAEIVQSPDDWAAGPRLESVVLEACLPVCCVIGDADELARRVEARRVRRALGLEPAAFVPRTSCTILDRETALSLQRIEAGCRAVIAARGAYGWDEVPDQPTVIDALRAASEKSAAELGALHADLGEVDPSLATLLKRAVRDLRSSLEKLSEKASRLSANRTGKSRRHLRRVNNALCPDGHLQEVRLGPLPIVARHGRAWIDELVDELDPLASEHLVLHLD